MNKTTASIIADKIVAQFKIGFQDMIVENYGPKIAIPDDSILHGAALRVISKEIADGFLRTKAFKEVKEDDLYKYRSAAAKLIKYQDCPATPEDFECWSGDYSGNLFNTDFSAESCMEFILLNAYVQWIKNHADYELARKKYQKRHK